MTQLDHAHTLRALHDEDDVLVLVNAWDVASAVALQDAGQRAIATASAAVAAAYGVEDGEKLPVDLVIDGVERIAAAVDLPVSVDMERGYGNAGESVRRLLQAGAVGCNLEDAMSDIATGCALVRAARTAGEAVGVPVVVNARTDTHLIDTGLDADDRLAEAVRRGLAYLDEGADCVFVPRCTDEAEIATLVEAFGRRRLSLLAVPGLPPLSRLRELGVARVSHGPFPHRHAMAALADYARDAVRHH